MTLHELVESQPFENAMLQPHYLWLAHHDTVSEQTWNDFLDLEYILGY